MSYRNDKIYYTTTKMHCRSASQIITGAAQITSLFEPLLLCSGRCTAPVERCTAPTTPTNSRSGGCCPPLLLRAHSRSGGRDQPLLL